MLGLYLLALGISGIKELKDDYECKKDVYELPNGIKYYFDRRGVQRRVGTNEIIDHSWDGLITTGVGKNRRVLYDQRQAYIDKWDKKDYERAKKEAEENGDGTIYHYNKYNPITNERRPVDAKTGKFYHLCEMDIYERTKYGERKIGTKYYIGYYEDDRFNVHHTDVREITKDYYYKMDTLFTKSPDLNLQIRDEQKKKEAMESK
jgi:hypothetical protein